MILKHVGIAAVVLLGLAAPQPAFAEGEEPAPAPLHGRHALAARLGVFNHGSVEVSSGTAGSSTRVSGFAGYGSYAYGVAPEWMVGVTAGSLDAEVLSSATPGSVVSRIGSIHARSTPKTTGDQKLASTLPLESTATSRRTSFGSSGWPCHAMTAIFPSCPAKFSCRCPTAVVSVLISSIRPDSSGNPST